MITDEKAQPRGTETEQPRETEQLTPVQLASQIISFVEIECTVILHKGMFCFIHAYDAQRQKIKIFQVQLSQEEYNNWIDDNEMESLILLKAGLKKI